MLDSHYGYLTWLATLLLDFRPVIITTDSGHGSNLWTHLIL